MSQGTNPIDALGDEHELLCEQRLKRVLVNARMTVLPSFWVFEEFPDSEFVRRARRSSLALVRNQDTWSQLVEVDRTTARQDRLNVWLFEFASEPSNAGFVGWLASEIRRRSGTGVAVICGYDSARGGIYDYWACPQLAFESVQSTIRELTSDSNVVADSLDGRIMNAPVTAPNGVIDSETIFRFTQVGDQFRAEYSGGHVSSGLLCGVRNGSEATFRYVQSHKDGENASGESRCVIERLPDGRLQLRESFQWADGRGSGENIIRELATSER
ncbi:MAG: DUF6196 family protein [Acidobacteriota bacterium]